MPADVQVQKDAGRRITGEAEKVLTIEGDYKEIFELYHNGWSLLEGVSSRRAYNKHRNMKIAAVAFGDVEKASKAWRTY